MIAFPKKKTGDSKYMIPNDIMSKALNTINAFFGSTLLIYTKYSQIVYEGDSLKLFGLVSYNSSADRWEMPDPIAFINGETGTKDNLISYFTY